MTFSEKLEKCRAAVEAGEMYPECPRCDGSRYESAIPYSEIDSIRPTVEEYPCPLCVMVGSIEAERAIEWLEEKVEMEE
jgi:hypothetical protein